MQRLAGRGLALDDSDRLAGQLLAFLEGNPGLSWVSYGDEAGTFNEPGGLSIAGGKLYVADTSSHRIRVVDLDTRAVTTLELQGVTELKH